MEKLKFQFTGEELFEYDKDDSYVTIHGDKIIFVYMNVKFISDALKKYNGCLVHITVHGEITIYNDTDVLYDGLICNLEA